MTEQTTPAGVIPWLAQNDENWILPDENRIHWLHRAERIQVWGPIGGKWSYSREGHPQIYRDAESFEDAALKALLL